MRRNHPEPPIISSGSLRHLRSLIASFRGRLQTLHWFLKDQAKRIGNRPNETARKRTRSRPPVRVEGRPTGINLPGTSQPTLCRPVLTKSSESKQRLQRRENHLQCPETNGRDSNETVPLPLPFPPQRRSFLCKTCVYLLSSGFFGHSTAVLSTLPPSSPSSLSFSPHLPTETRGNQLDLFFKRNRCCTKTGHLESRSSLSYLHLVLPNCRGGSPFQHMFLYITQGVS